MRTVVSSAARALFQITAYLGRRVGGIRPRRIGNILGQWGYGQSAPEADDFRWIRDRYGSELLLHPYFLIDRQIMVAGCYEPELHSYIARTVTRGMICLDVGANIGAMSLHMGQRVGSDGRILCFEPVPQVASRLETNIARNGMTSTVEVHRVALTDRDGEAAIRTAPPSHSNQGMASLVEHDHGALTETIVIRCATLDAYLSRTSIPRLDFIKVDIQGSEPAFISGAHRTLERFRPRVAMEVAPRSLESVGVTSLSLIKMMEHLDYNAWELDKKGRLTTMLDVRDCRPDFSADSVIFVPREFSGRQRLTDANPETGK